MSRRPARCTQADITRALRAADQAGAGWAVEILPDGVIRIIPMSEAAPRRPAPEPEVEPEEEIVL